MKAVCDENSDIFELSNSSKNSMAGCRKQPKAYAKVQQIAANELKGTATFERVMYGSFSESGKKEALIFTCHGFRVGLATLAIADISGWKRLWQGDLYPLNTCYPFKGQNGKPVLLCSTASMHQGNCFQRYVSLKFSNGTPQELQKLMDTNWACGTSIDDLIKSGYKETQEQVSSKWNSDGNPGITVHIRRTRWTGKAPDYKFQEDELDRHLAWNGQRFEEK